MFQGVWTPNIVAPSSSNIFWFQTWFFSPNVIQISFHLFILLLDNCFPLDTVIYIGTTLTFDLRGKLLWEMSIVKRGHLTPLRENVRHINSVLCGLLSAKSSYRALLIALPLHQTLQYIIANWYHSIPKLYFHVASYFHL